AVAAALDVQQRPNRSLDDSIVELLAAQSVLLVLDNCEHVLDTTSELVELVWSVPPLPVPASADEPLATLVDVPAVQLFVERARSVQRTFVLDDGNRAAVA